MTLTSTCPNCGANNAPGAVFCVSCGTSLEVPGATNPPSTPPSTAPSPPPSTPPSPRRSSMTSLAAIVVGASLAVAAVAVAIAVVIAGRPPTSVVDGPSTGGLKVLEVEYIRAEVPTDWDLVSRSRDTLAVEDRTSRAMWLRSANVPAAITLDQIQARFVDKATGQSPDAQICAGPETAAVPGGPTDGRYFVICSTFIPQGGGPAVRLADAYYLGTGNAGITVMVMQLTAVPEALEAFATEVRQLPPPVWKLYRG